MATMLADDTMAIVLSLLLLTLASINMLNVVFKEDLSDSFPVGTFFTSLTLKALVLVGLFLQFLPEASLFALIVMGFLLDLYIISKLQGEHVGKFFVFLIFSLVAFHVSDFFDFRADEVFLGVNLGINLSSFALILILFYQLRLLDASWQLDFSERKLIKAVTVLTFGLAILFTGFLVIDGVSTNPVDFEYFKYFLVVCLAAAFFQSVVFIRLLWISKLKSIEKSRQLNHEYNIWNAYGFVRNVGSVRRICARLDQGVTLAVFKFEDYELIQKGMSAEEFLKFKRSAIAFLKFSLRKHDQLAILDQNIFAVLLPFTDRVKGEMACIRLREQTRKEMRTQGFILPRELGMRFGLTQVGRKEPDVLDALIRAAQALAKAKPFGVSQY